MNLVKTLQKISIVSMMAFAFVGTSCSYDMTPVSFSDATYIYDGTQKSLEITGTLPTGVTVTYANNDKTDVGIYTVVASFTGDSIHKAIEDLTATLTIEKGTVSGISFTDSTVVYDGAEHSILISGNLPSGVSVSYSNNGKVNNGI